MLRKPGLITLLLCVTLALGAQTTLRTQFTDCSQAPTLFVFDGSNFKPYKLFDGKDGVYSVTVPDREARMYYLGFSVSENTPVVLGGDKEVLAKGSCRAVRGITFESPLNNQYQAMKVELGRLSTEARRHQMTYNRGGDETAKQQALIEMAATDAARLQFLDSLRQVSPFLGRIVALNTYLSFPNHGASKYANEVEYFANTFFQHVDFADTKYNDLPWVFEAAKNYTATLLSVNMDADQLTPILSGEFKRWPAGSLAQRMAYSGALTSLRQKNHGSFAQLGAEFIALYEKSNPGAVADLQREMKEAQSFMVGGEAPDFGQATPDGKEMRLSELRGKVVLVDFWASWCGPCRRENPNVVRLYNQYREQGFDILGVSLDRDMERWVGAIEADGLDWHHISDLKGWNNEVAQLYGVKSIPHTLLLDAQGRIIARNLRGPALEQKLQEIFGAGQK